MRYLIVALPFVLLFLAAMFFAFSEKIKTVSYTVKSEKVKNKIKIVHLSDLHSSGYGKDCRELVERINALSPDLILITGDLADDRVDNGNAFSLAKAIGEKYTCYYVSGNHEVYTGICDRIKSKLESFGITVLEGESESVMVGKSEISICGIDDPYAFPDKTMRMWEDQLWDCANAVVPERFSILLTHRPELVDYYNDTNIDLVLAGHAHGGQVIIPYLLNGLYAPHQGWFPKYAGGRYELDNGEMIVSRGLSKYIKPRVFNRPELVYIEIIPK